MIAQHSGPLTELQIHSLRIASQTDAYLAAGGLIHQAAPSIYVLRTHSSRLPRDEAADLVYQSAREVAEQKLAFAEKIRAMALVMSQKDISETTGVHRKVLFALGQKHGFRFKFGRAAVPRTSAPYVDRSLDSARVERICAFKELGTTRAQAIRQLGISRSLFLRLTSEYGIDYPLVGDVSQ